MTSDRVSDIIRVIKQADLRVNIQADRHDIKQADRHDIKQADGMTFGRMTDVILSKSLIIDYLMNDPNSNGAIFITCHLPSLPSPHSEV